VRDDIETYRDLGIEEIVVEFVDIPRRRGSRCSPTRSSPSSPEPLTVARLFEERFGTGTRRRPSLERGHESPSARRPWATG
jgi:hypothetical protein